MPDALAEVCTTETWERAFHSHGAHLTDRTDAFHLRFPNPTDAVAHPRTEAELAAVLDWCSSADVKVVPFGAGSSVVWGVNPPEADAVVTVAMDRFDRVLEVDPVSRAARIQAGVYGPALEDQLRPHGFTLRHFPQSFRFSTLGGWIATRSGGHYATNHTHIDDFVESVRMLTPNGWWESRRLPGSGAGPSPDRMVIGSEGILGVITEAWMRIQRRPTFRATAGIVFPTWEAGTDAVRQIVQAKLWPANCRILDPVEAGRAAGLDGTASLVIVSFESAELSQRHAIGAAVEIARAAGGDRSPTTTSRSTTAGASPPAAAAASARGGTRSSASIPGLDTSLGLVADTFETAITWDRWPAFDAAVRERVTARPARGLRADGRAVVPLHPRLPRRSGAVLHVVRDGPAGLRAVAVGRDQVGRQRSRARRRRHDHPPPRRRPDAPSAVRPPAPRAVRHRAARRQARRRPRRHHEPRRA